LAYGSARWPTGKFGLWVGTYIIPAANFAELLRNKLFANSEEGYYSEPDSSDSLPSVTHLFPDDVGVTPFI
jgi:hypothetical protein